MNLHRIDGQPEWANIPKSKQNIWQRVAVRTNGIVTPGNIVTITGLCVVVFALQQLAIAHYWVAAAALAAGRMLDIVDGLLADKTGTKSPFGELLDATVDKIGTFLTGVVFVISAIAPLWLILAVLLPYIATTLIVFYAHFARVRLHPSQVGKIGMAVAWVSLVGFVIAKAAHAPLGSSVLGLAVSFLAMLAAGMATFATAQYARDLRIKLARP